jgi:hypothetical protein
MNISNATRRTLAAVVLACSISLASAESPPDAPPNPGQHSGQPPGPPPEALQACSGKTEGTVVSFALRDGHQVSGTCQMTNGVLAARPTGNPRGP